MEKGDPRFMLDRSKVRILLCDNDAKSSQEVLHLLSNCSYQVTSVRTARQVIDVLATHGPDIDIILAEVDLPVAKGFKMLKYINRDQDLRRIPIIMMSSQDEVSIVVKCLRLGAADYLVKPLRMNELLNLWTHMWRRRRMLGVSEKDVVVHDLELAFSDPSDTHTNSTIILSDDTDVKPSEGVGPDLNVPDHQENELKSSPLEHVQNVSVDKEPKILEDGDGAGGKFSCPKKTDLKVGESSAFFTYVRSSLPTSNSQCIHVNHNPDSSRLNTEENNAGRDHAEENNIGWQQQNYHHHASVFVNGENTCNMSTFPMAMKFPVICLSSPNTQQLQRAEGPNDVSAVPPVFPLPLYMPGIMHQNVLPPSIQIFNSAPAVPHYNAPAQYPQLPVVPAFPYHPINMNMQSGHTSTTSSSKNEMMCDRTERRVAALRKFRQKKKDRCFDKKIRYVNRKRLAEKRPRVRGQFVRQLNGVDVVNDGSTVDCDSDDEDEESFMRYVEVDSFSEQNAFES